MSKKATSSKSENPKTTRKSSKFKPIDESQLRCAFEMMDINHDGKLNADEMKRMLQKLGIPIRDQIVDQLLINASKSGNGLISETEFLTWLSKIKTPKEDDTEQDLKAAFSVFDKDNNGFITKDELKSAMSLIGEETLTDRDLEELLRVTDLDKDGKINYDEFIKMLI